MTDQLSELQVLVARVIRDAEWDDRDAGGYAHSGRVPIELLTSLCQVAGFGGLEDALQAHEANYHTSLNDNSHD